MPPYLARGVRGPVNRVGRDRLESAFVKAATKRFDSPSMVSEMQSWKWSVSEIWMAGVGWPQNSRCRIRKPRKEYRIF